ncbi:MAG: tRNA pseudouridine(13) synthase TruD, partial [Woeseiaceae bacterium]
MPASSSSLPEWCRAYGDRLILGLTKQTPCDFRVVERVNFALTGDGEHDYLWIEKTGANTAWVARMLAQHAGVAQRDVGYAGLKDRHAVTRQWFSVRRPSKQGTDWGELKIEGVRILEADRHQRKLKRGAHAGNRFHIALREVITDDVDIEHRLETISARGIPNYFGAQRFGRGANNLQMAAGLAAGKRMQREKRGIALSAARSFLFNEILSARVADGSWDKALPGDTLNLDGSGSVFVPDGIDDAITRRIAALDVHPTGALWGDIQAGADSAPALLERTIADRYPEYVQCLRAARMKPARRALRTVVRELTWQIEETDIYLEFELDRGSFATSVLRE